jgi:hypothetical protein
VLYRHCFFFKESTIRQIQENQTGFKLGGTHQFPVYADDLHLLEDNINTTSKNTEALADITKEVSLEINVEQTKPRHQTAERNHNIKVANGSFGNETKFKYLGR